MTKGRTKPRESDRLTPRGRKGRYPNDEDQSEKTDVEFHVEVLDTRESEIGGFILALLDRRSLINPNSKSRVLLAGGIFTHIEPLVHQNLDNTDREYADPTISICLTISICSNTCTPTALQTHTLQEP